MTISKKLLDELLKGCERPEYLLGDAGLMKELKIRLMERMLGAELTAHLGYEEGGAAPATQPNRRNGSSGKVLKSQDGDFPVAIPRDRDSSFEPELVKKGQTRIDGIDDKIIGLYAAGLTVRDIQAHLLDLYGLKVSPDLISRVTDAVLDEVREWQGRALERMYPIVIFDGCHCCAIGPSDNGDGCGEAVMAQGSDKGLGFPMTERRSGMQPLAALRSPAQPGHLRGGAVRHSARTGGAGMAHHR